MDSDLVYSSDCYLQKRGSMRKGFGGNYRRASASFAVSRTKPSSESGSDAKHFYSSLKSSSFCHKNDGGETNQLSSSSSSSGSSSCLLTAANVENQQQSEYIQQSDSLQETMEKPEKKLVTFMDRKYDNLGTTSRTSAVPSAGSQIQSRANGSEGEKRQTSLAGSRGSLLQLNEEEILGVSVMEYVKNLERTDAQLCSASEDISKNVTQTRIAKLRETFLHRSSENFATDASCSDPLRVIKRPVSAVIECSIGTFPKVPINLIHRHSIGSLLKPSCHAIQQRPSLTILNPVYEPISNADKNEFRKCESPTGSCQTNSTRWRSFELCSSLGHNSIGGNISSLQEKSNFESNNKTETETDVSCDMSISGADISVGGLVKTDSSDSGIDTKTDCFGNKISPDAMECLPVGQFQTIASLENASLEKLGPSSVNCQSTDSSHIQGNVSVSVEQRSGIIEMENYTHGPESALKGDSFTFSTSAVFVDLESEELAKISSEEVLFKELAVRVLSRLKDSDSELRSVLTPSEFYRTPFHYMVDIIQGIKIPEYWLKQLPVNTDAECITSERSLEEDKEALLDSIKSKLELLKKNRELIKQKVSERKNVESQISNVIKCRLEKKKYDKYCLYISELDKVLQLMFILASRLANTENSLNHLQPEHSETLRKSLTAKQASLVEKLQDAKLLKNGIDHRSEVVNSFLKVRLSGSEYAAYQDMVASVVRLHFLHQWTEYRLLLCERQLKALNANLMTSGSLQC